MAKGFDETANCRVSSGRTARGAARVTNLASVKPAQLFPLLASELAFTEQGIDRPEYLSSLPTLSTPPAIALIWSFERRQRGTNQT